MYTFEIMNVVLPCSQLAVSSTNGEILLQRKPHGQAERVEIHDTPNEHTRQGPEFYGNDFNEVGVPLLHRKIGKMLDKKHIPVRIKPKRPSRKSHIDFVNCG